MSRRSALAGIALSFAFDPTGGFLSCCNERADDVTFFRVDRKKGGFTFTGQCVSVGDLSHVVFLDLAKSGKDFLDATVIRHAITESVVSQYHQSPMIVAEWRKPESPESRNSKPGGSDIGPVSGFTAPHLELVTIRSSALVVRAIATRDMSDGRCSAPFEWPDLLYRSH
jgi:hypothetical protein